MSAHFLIKVAMVAGERLFKEEPMVVAVRAAIDATADQFVQLEGVRENLQKWQDSPEFAGLLARLQKAEIAPESADLAGSFISMGFYVPEKMGEVAESILDSFAENLRGELLKTDIGLQILADTAEKGLQPTRSRFADKILEIYRDFSLYMVCGGDSIYHQQTLSQYRTSSAWRSLANLLATDESRGSTSSNVGCPCRYTEIVTQFVDDGQPDLFADFRVAGANRLNILLVQDDMIGSARQVEYAFLRGGHAMKDAEKQPAPAGARKVVEHSQSRVFAMDRTRGVIRARASERP
jgi:hypothetical protein